MSKERRRDRIIGHGADNDGIEEYDNPLPDWWIGLTLFTVAFGIVYAVDYHFVSRHSEAGDYKAEIAEANKLWPPVVAAEVGPDGPTDLQVPAIVQISVDPAQVAAGEKVFTDHGCSGCHQFGHKLVGPDLAGVTARRTPTWIEKQVRYPDKMTREDPVSKQLLATLGVQMTDQHVADDQLPALLAFLASHTITTDANAPAPSGTPAGATSPASGSPDAGTPAPTTSSPAPAAPGQPG